METSENQRLIEVQKKLGFSSQKDFAEALGIKQGSLSDIYREKKGIKVSLSIKKTLKKEFSINIKWLETGEGNMFEEPVLEAENWIVDDLSRYNSPNHDKTSLERLGLRLDELCRIKNMNYQDLSELINVDYVELASIISGNKPTPASLLEKIMDNIPEIRPLWLILGYGAIFKEVAENKDEEIKRLKQEVEELKKRTYSTENVDRKTA
jgi:bacteriophage CI repressor helix-turn-helix domain